jgi:RNase H-fold protein (predicted Holliday junction resolvase)
VIVLGDRTHSKEVRAILKLFNVPIEVVDENRSSMEGRYRYLKENTVGFAKLLPIGLRAPKHPFDDYVAVVLAERFLKKHPNYFTMDPRVLS